MDRHTDHAGKGFMYYGAAGHPAQALRRTAPPAMTAAQINSELETLERLEVQRALEAVRRLRHEVRTATRELQQAVHAAALLNEAHQKGNAR